MHQLIAAVIAFAGTGAIAYSLYRALAHVGRHPFYQYPWTAGFTVWFIWACLWGAWWLYR